MFECTHCAYKKVNATTWLNKTPALQISKIASVNTANRHAFQFHLGSVAQLPQFKNTEWKGSDDQGSHQFLQFALAVRRLHRYMHKDTVPSVQCVLECCSETAGHLWLPASASAHTVDHLTGSFATCECRPDVAADKWSRNSLVRNISECLFLLNHDIYIYDKDKQYRICNYVRASII